MPPECGFSIGPYRECRSSHVGSRGEDRDRNRDARHDPYDHFAPRMTAFPDRGVGDHLRQLREFSPFQALVWIVFSFLTRSEFRTMWSTARLSSFNPTLDLFQEGNARKGWAWRTRPSKSAIALSCRRVRPISSTPFKRQNLRKASISK